jgi:DNA mismatch endonuclease (patch repair protein)
MDNLTARQRSHCMSRVRNRDTDLEILVRSALFKRGWRFKKHVSSLPGTPDIVFSRQKIAVFIDGDFWHGYRFSSWERSLSSFWKIKIQKNRKRDQKNFSKLRRRGWRVIRVWQHEIETNFGTSIKRIENLLMSQN